MNSGTRLLIGAGAALGGVLLLRSAPAAECLKDQKTCKVIVVTPEQADSMKKLIENTGLAGPYNQIKQAIEFYVKLIDDAPAGTVADPAKPAPTPEVKK